MRFALAALALMLSGSAYAQQLSPLTGTTASPPAAPAPGTTAPRRAHVRQTAQQRFEAANTTHDGKLTLDQARTGNMRRIVTNFDAIDTTKKGFVTMDDLHAFNRAQRAARKPAMP